MKKLTWVTELSNEGLEVLSNAYCTMLEEYDYSVEDIEMYMEDLMNEKLSNLEDAVGVDVLEKVMNM